VHSNGDVKVNSSSSISAAMVQATLTATGPITPSPQTDAPPIDDPFATMNLDAGVKNCSSTNTKVMVGETATLASGIHCGDLDVGAGATLNLAPGEHYFMKGRLRLHDDARMTGDDVVLFFDRQSDFSFEDKSDIRLRGRRTGSYAGFVLATTRDNTHEFNISTASARELLGTVYVPNAMLKVSGDKSVADQSAWTVVVARSVKVTGSANLVINANYSSSTVPVPVGVGPNAARARLTR
jgi:hypothetical protein